MIYYEDVDDKVEAMCIDHIVDGNALTKQIDKVILGNRSWATVMFRYKRWSNYEGRYGEDIYAIHRYKKNPKGWPGIRSRMIFFSKPQIRTMIDTLTRWLEDGDDRDKENGA